jgi:Tol biopolymer transport system component
VRQIYRKDMTSGTTPPTPGALVRVSVNDAGDPADQISLAPSISGSGDTVAFSSAARNLSRSSISGLQQVFARELPGGPTTLESLGAATTSRASTTPVLSSTGQYLAFESLGVLDPYDFDLGTMDVYLRDRGPLNTTVLASRSPNRLAGAVSSGPSISGDGRWVAYSSIDDKVFGNESSDDTNGTFADVFIYDRLSDRENPSVRYVSLNDAGEQATLPSVGASVSGDGHFVLFASAAQNLSDRPSSGLQLYVRNLLSNQRPVVDAGPDETVAEGDWLMRTGRFSDLDASTTWYATADLGAGAFRITVSPTTKQWTLSHEPLAVGTYDVIVSVTDGEGATGSDTFRHTVTNVDPSVNLGAEAFLDFGAALHRRAVLSDPGSNSPVPQPAETYSATVDYGDGTGVSDLVLDGNYFWLDHTYAKPGTYVVSVNASDSNGGVGSGFLTVHVVNHRPVVDAGRDETVAEGDWLMRTGSFSDLDASTTWSATADFGAGAFPIRVNPTTKQWTLSHEPLAVGTYVVTVAVTDGEGATGSDTFRHTVTNVEPSVNLGAEAFVYFGSTLHRRASFSDPGSNSPVPQPAETYSATVDYGDGTGASDLVLDGNRFWLDHTYATDGTYVVRVSVSDSNRGVGSGRLTVHVFDYSFEWVGPLADKFVVGRNLPVKFTVRDPDGSFILDRSVQVDVVDAEGNLMAGPYTFGDQPSRSVTVSGDAYRVNVDTKDLEAGMYTLRVRFSSPTLSGEFTLSTNGTASAARSGLRD